MRNPKREELKGFSKLGKNSVFMNYLQECLGVSIDSVIEKGDDVVRGEARTLKHIIKMAEQADELLRESQL